MQRESTPIFGGRKVILRETARAVTPFGGLSVFFEFLGRIGYAAAIREHMPVVLTSPNAIEPAQTFTGFLVAVMAGDPSTVERGTYLLWIAHNLERIGDRITNISERVIFMTTGQIGMVYP